MLIFNLVQNDRKQSIEMIQNQSEKKQRELVDAKALFSDDMQRFQSMKSEMEAISQLRDEELINEKIKGKELQRIKEQLDAQKEIKDIEIAALKEEIFK